MLPTIGAVIVIGLGVLGLVWPRTAANFVRIAPVDTTGVSEIRATYGGVFLGLGIAALVMNQSSVYDAIGIGFGLAAVSRAASVVIDRSREPHNFAGIAFESVIALLLLL
jgi:Domain of unknown function (DUF4345)